METKGGSELQAYYIARELIRRDWEIHYIREHNDWSGKELIIDGIILHALPVRDNHFRLLNIFYLKKIMEKIKADVWYCRATTNYVAPVAWAARKIGGRVVWACSHDIQVSKKLFRRTVKNPFKKTVHAFLQLASRSLFSQSLKYTDHIILQSDTQNLMLNSNYNQNGIVIHNAHPIPGFPDIKREYYLGIVLDRTSEMPVIIASTEGGMEIEAVAEQSPEKIIKVAVFLVKHSPILGHLASSQTVCKERERRSLCIS